MVGGGGGVCLFACLIYFWYGFVFPCFVLFNLVFVVCFGCLFWGFVLFLLYVSERKNGIVALHFPTEHWL